MYHEIVRRRVVALFAAVSSGDARPVIEGLAPRFEHFFLGDHALGGRRVTLEKTRLWYERLYRLLPDTVSICAPSGFPGRLGTL